MAEFKPAFDFTIGNEDSTRSGVVTHDGDGRTRFGICERFNRDLPEEFWTGDAAAALNRASMIYRDHYWSPLHLGDIVDQAIATKIFDMAVPMGCKEAAKLAQRVANGLLLGSTKAPAIDGKIGSQTIAALNACPPASVVEALCNLSKVFFCQVAADNPAKQVDLKGWLNRAAKVPPHQPPWQTLAKAATAVVVFALALCSSVSLAQQLPKAALTPGAATSSTSVQLCSQKFHTRDVRLVTDAMKRQVFTGYGIKCYPVVTAKAPGVQACSAYEVDHLISLELGGANDVKNLWPQPIAEARHKDVLENWLHAQVCAGALTLKDAQKRIATDWVSEFRRMGKVKSQ